MFWILPTNNFSVPSSSSSLLLVLFCWHLSVFSCLIFCFATFVKMISSIVFFSSFCASKYLNHCIRLFFVFVGWEQFLFAFQKIAAASAPILSIFFIAFEWHIRAYCIVYRAFSTISRWNLFIFVIWQKEGGGDDEDDDEDNVKRREMFFFISLNGREKEKLRST